MSTFFEVVLGVSALLLCASLAFKCVSETQLRNRAAAFGQNLILGGGAIVGAIYTFATVLSVVDIETHRQRIAIEELRRRVNTRVVH